MTRNDDITRHGVTARWADAVVHRGVAYFVEVPDDPTLPPAGQIAMVLAQVDTRLALVESDRTRLLQVLIYLPFPEDLAEFNRQWEAWVPAGHAPSRACVHVPLAAAGYRVELVLTAAARESTEPRR
jgi:enamine deaminase RidA (YjgF/YER057c/UK114 family)